MKFKVGNLAITKYRDESSACYNDILVRIEEIYEYEENWLIIRALHRHDFYGGISSFDLVPNKAPDLEDVL